MRYPFQAGSAGLPPFTCCPAKYKIAVVSSQPPEVRVEAAKSGLGDSSVQLGAQHHWNPAAIDGLSGAVAGQAVSGAETVPGSHLACSLWSHIQTSRCNSKRMPDWSPTGIASLIQAAIEAIADISGCLDDGFSYMDPAKQLKRRSRGCSSCSQRTSRRHQQLRDIPPPKNGALTDVPEVFNVDS